MPGRSLGKRFNCGLMLAALAVGASVACKGGGNAGSPTEPTTTTPTTGSTALPLGQASAGAATCPAGTPAGRTCTRLTISCPSVAGASAVLRVTRPAAAVTNRGTIVLTSGGDGTTYPGNIFLSPAMVATFAGDGLTVVEVAWDAPGIWGGPQARTLACRYATAAKWAYDNIHTGGAATLFAAQGTSGGAAQIAFGLAHYGVGDFLDLANLGGGPPICPRCAPGGPPPEPLLPQTLSPTCFFPSNVSVREPLLNYPATVVHSFLGDQDPNHECTADNARAYSAAITSQKSLTIVPGTAHNIEETQAGIDAYVGSVRSAIR